MLLVFWCCVPSRPRARELRKAMRTKKVSFYDESASEERVPLLSPSNSKDERAGLDAETSDGDAVAELEGLSRLMVRSCKVFTVASCLSALLGSVSLVQERCTSNLRVRLPAV